MRNPSRRTCPVAAGAFVAASVPALAFVAAVASAAAAPTSAAAQAAPDANSTSRACAPGALYPDAPPETRQFDFLVGRFDITLHAWTGEGWSPPRPVNARWEGWYALDGRAIQDEWFDLDTRDGRSPVRGVNLRIYDPGEAVWKLMWIAQPAYQVQDLRAEARDGVLTMWQIYPERPGWRAEFEITDEDHWARVSWVQDEETGEWTREFRLAATRIPCGG